MKARRRGAALETAVLEATWAELVEGGYATLTMASVAARAGTSRPVLSRRWQGRADLALAAIRHELAKHPLDVPTGSNVREELLALMANAAERGTATAVSVLVVLGEFSAALGSTPEHLRELAVSHEKSALDAILDRAVARGEIDPDLLTPPIESLLVDLFRHHMIMHLSAPEPELMRAWVDDMFLPLVRRQVSASGEPDCGEPVEGGTSELKTTAVHDR